MIGNSQSWLYRIFLGILLVLAGDVCGKDPAAACGTSKPKEIKLCLTMIVKNESKIIERCLDSVKDIVDCVSICDTGSSDDTVEIIERYLSTHKIPGKVHHHEWKNFGHNRTLSAKAAQDTLKEFGFSLPHTYLLLLDADMVFVITPEFQKNRLTKDHYLLVQKSFWNTYYNTRLMRASLPWECLGVTHEYWSCKVSRSTEKLKTLWIDDRGDGGCKADKFQRDVDLLTKGLEEEPGNARYKFYLAQSYKCLKQYEEAIKWYKERIAQGGWKEEVWYSKFMIGDIYQTMGDWEKALIWYLDAYQHNPERAEPLERIALNYRTQNQNALAYLFAAQGAKIPYPADQILFIADPVYDYRFDEELSISAFYTPFKEEGFAALERLLTNKRAPASAKYLAERNLHFYIENLKNVRFQSLPITPPSVREGSKIRCNPTNPSILKTDEGYLVICRCVNYTQKGAKDYRMIDPEAKNNFVVKTRNYLLQYDKKFHLLSQKEIIDELSPPMRHSPFTAIEGLEDCRIFEHDQAIWATCTVQDMNPYHVPQIGLYRLDKTNADPQRSAVQHFVPLQGPVEGRCEKNWLPFVKDGDIHVIYSYDPFIIYKIDPLTGGFEQVVNRDEKLDFSRFRGSAGPIPFDDGYLAVVHHVGYDNGRYYYHRFLYLDKDFAITRISRPFTYRSAAIEFCCGMTVDHSGSQLIMSLGVEDREAMLAFIDLEKVRSLLLPVEK